MPRTCTACSHEHRNEIRLLPEEMEARGSTSSELDDRPLNTVTDVLLLRILAREPGMTEANFLRIARGDNSFKPIDVETDRDCADFDPTPEWLARG